MKSIFSISFLLLLGVGLLLMVGCQSKEVTSAKVYIQQDDWDKAIEQLELAVESFPNDAEAHMLLGRGYGKKGWHKKMVDEFNASLAISPKFENEISQERTYYWTNEFNAGVKAYNDGNIELAQKRFETSIMLDSSRADAYKHLATVYQREKIMDKAIEIYEILTKKYPKDIEALLRLSDFYNIEKQHEKATEVLLQAKELDPENVDLLSSLAITYDMQGDTSKAFQVYNEAIKRSPDNPDLLFNLGRLYFMRGDFQNAIVNFDKVIENDPNDFQSNLNVGNAEKVKDYYRKVIPYLEKALEVKPEEAPVWNNLGVAYIRTDQMDKGKEAFKKSEELSKGEN